MASRTLMDEFNETGEIPAELEVASRFWPLETAPHPEIKCPSCGGIAGLISVYDLEPPGVLPPDRLPMAIRNRILSGPEKGRYGSPPRWICHRCYKRITRQVVIEEHGQKVPKFDTDEELLGFFQEIHDRTKAHMGGGRVGEPPGLSRPWTPGYRRADDHAQGKGPPEIDPRRSRR